MTSVGLLYLGRKIVLWGMSGVLETPRTKEHTHSVATNISRMRNRNSFEG